MEHSQNLLENSFSFILRAIQNLTDSSEAEDEKSKCEELKYTILHLWSGICLLLKARLCQEHWSLVVSNIDKTSFEKLQS